MTNLDSRARSALCAVLLVASSSAQSLPFRRFDVAEGLSGSRITCVHQDRRGYLWIGTWEGLSRFDGARFVRYGVDDGLASPFVHAIAEDRDGHLWIATTGGGLLRLDETPHSHGEKALFESFPLGDAPATGDVQSLVAAPDGTLWCGTALSLWHVIPSANGVRTEKVLANTQIGWPDGGAQAPDGRVWFGATHEVIEIEGARAIRHAIPSELDLGEVVSCDPKLRDHVIVAGDRGVLELDATVDPVRWRRLDVKLAPDQLVRCTCRDAYGTLWLGTRNGLVRVSPAGQETFRTEQGLSDDSIRTLGLDRDGELWIGTWSGGLCRLATRGIVSWTRAGGLPEGTCTRLSEEPGGAMLVATERWLARIEGARVTSLGQPDDPGAEGVGMRLLCDSRGDTWIGSNSTLLRLRGPRAEIAHAEDARTTFALPPGNPFGAPYEDPHGTLWSANDRGRVSWLARGAAHFESAEIPKDLGVNDAPREMLMSPSGVMWLASYDHLVRFQGGKFDAVRLDPNEGTPRARCMHFDARGRLWVGTRFHGLWWSDDPDAEKPRFAHATTKDGLASDAIWSIETDARGRLYLGTGRGLDRLDPSTLRIVHRRSFDGLAGDVIYHVIADHEGRMWVATSGGVSRIDPDVDDPPPAPTDAWIERVVAGGEEVPVGERGARTVDAGELSAGRGDLEVRFGAPSLRVGAELSFEFELEGAASGWSPATQQREVRYARLGPGTYRFRVRALHPAWSALVPAEVTFRVLPPVWQRAWFLAAAALVLFALAWSVQRARERRRLAVEGMRRRIATDIHDDVGAGLAQIAILSEVAKRDASSTSRERLDEVARLARSLRESMSEIIWTIDPRRDSFGDLVSRARQAAANLLEADGVRVEFNAPPQEELDRIPLAADRRRQVLQIVKEALTNAARHAHATQVTVTVRVEPRALHVTIEDDGRGFDASAAATGHGLVGMRERAATLGAELAVRSRPAAGTTIELEIPL